MVEPRSKQIHLASLSGWWHGPGQVVTSVPSVPSVPLRGLGDAVAAIATPIARALKLPCIDPATQQLKSDSGCAKRRAALNRAVPFPTDQPHSNTKKP